MRRVQAWERLNDHNYSSGLSMEGLYALLIEAGYRPEVAERAACRRGWERLDVGVTA